MKDRFKTSLAGAAGFTLIEILVAATISSLIIIMLHTAYRSTLESIKSVSGFAEYHERITIALNMLGRDLSNTYISKDNPKTLFISDVVANNSRIFFVSTNRVDFSAAGNFKKPYLMSDIRQTGYYLKENRKKSRTYILIRNEKNHYDDDFETGGFENEILDNVAGLRFQYRQGNDWIDKWDSRENKRIPDSVRTTLTTINSAGKQEVFTIVTYITLGR